MRHESLVTTWRVLLGRQSQLVRGCDRIDAALRLSLAPLLLLLTVVAALSALTALHAGQGRERTQLLTMHPVQSTVLRMRDFSVSQPVYPAAMTSAWQAKVAWRNAAGVVRQANVVLFDKPKLGDRLTVWASRDGQVSTDLWHAQDSTAMALFAGLVCLSVGALLLTSARGLLRWAMNARQLHQWTAEWERISPNWTSRS